MDVAKQYSNNLKHKINPKLNKRSRQLTSLAEKVHPSSTANDSAVIDSFLTQKDVASWFRGTSSYHMDGANMLLNALRDDAEQSTTHRVRACLRLIGLKPMITSKEIEFLMNVSRGNDLAFLWFLMEMHYKTPKPGAYSVNEQLICSAICHLDTITTLRELDKILPKADLSRTERAKSCTKRGKLKKFDGKNKKVIKLEYVLPYFEKIRRPKAYGKALTINIPNFRVDFDIYKLYSDVNHVVSNENNRWYAIYDFSPAKRITCRIIRDIVSEVFQDYEAAVLKANEKDILCSYHKTARRMEENRKYELRIKTRDEYLKRHFGINTKERAKNIKYSLHKAIEDQLCEFRKEANMPRKENTLVTVTSDCNLYDIVLGSEFNECCNMKPESKISKSSTTQVKFHKTMSIKENLYGSKRNVVINSDSLPKFTSCNSEFNEKYMSNYDYGHVGETPTTSQQFFHCPQLHKPHKFDYRKIFMPQSNDDDKRRIEKAFLKALDVTELQNSELNLDKLVTASANKTYQSSLRKYESEKKHQIADQIAQGDRPLSQYFNLPSYNYTDQNLMDQMLIDAFKHLRKNPKFVWAQLPDAHKIPMLREWIAQRFGKEYTQKERAEAYRLSCKIFRALDKKRFNFPMPTGNQMGKNRFVNYRCRKYLDTKCKHIKDEYYERFDNALMEQARIFWYAMRAYVCSNGPPRKTYFAYMPSRFGDIQHFRLWKSYEFRNYREAWDARRREKRSEQVNG